MLEPAIQQIFFHRVHHRGHGNRGIRGIAATHQYLKTDLSSERLARCDHAMRRVSRGASEIERFHGQKRECKSNGSNLGRAFEVLLVCF